MNDLHKLYPLLERMSAALERIAGGAVPVLDGSTPAYAWVATRAGGGHLRALHPADDVDLEDLQGIDTQKAALVQNTRQFLAGLPANNVLLTGARGTGKSSLLRALLKAYHAEGLRIVEVDKADLADLWQITPLLEARPERFIVFCDDLSFAEHDHAYRALKVALDGSLHSPPANVLIYATSNRRHLVSERMRDNLDTRHEDGEVRPADSVEEKISLSDRFGLLLTFYPQNQDVYLASARHWLQRLGGHWDEASQREALRFALARGSRSGRSAWQFAKAHAGAQALAATMKDDEFRLY